MTADEQCRMAYRQLIIFRRLHRPIRGKLFDDDDSFVELSFNVDHDEGILTVSKVAGMCSGGR